MLRRRACQLRRIPRCVRHRGRRVCRGGAHGRFGIGEPIVRSCVGEARGPAVLGGLAPGGCLDFDRRSTDRLAQIEELAGSRLESRVFYEAGGHGPEARLELARGGPLKQPPQLGREGSGILIALSRVSSQSSGQQIGDRRGDFGPVLPDIRHFGVAHPHHGLGFASRIEERAPREHFVEHDTYREEIGAAVDWLTVDLLGGHVSKAPAGSVRVREGALGVRGHGHQVGELDAPISGDEDALGGHVSVDEAERLAVFVGHGVNESETEEQL